ncbi:molybdate ABC transporter substrate-binding protein [Listeria grandensis]|uniref:Molybdate ABC transporter substrate-binding protein n=1 Tax=Listeria grandensis TaxID=1494963 RepID=A0A7X0Y5R9_9LIST|nr:molybdate ABC transporter substrate-binding protein [Listeria grandensis]MBC1937333.1 molybdate ABC transporter substrate-binding protein [Listeria grandensis]
MKKWIKSGLIFAGVLLVLAGCGTQEPQTIHISVAASLKDVMDDVRPLYEKEHDHVTLEFDFAGSGQIRERVENGAPIDGVLLASVADTDKLMAKKLIDGKQEIASNTLVAVMPSKTVPSGDIESELAKARVIAIGDPASVPAGKYAEEFLTKEKLMARVKSRLVKASDVRQVLAYVESGNADIGFVYQTDAMISKKVQTAYKVSNELHSPIGYYAATVKDTDAVDETSQFMDYMKGTQAQKILKKYGFGGAN